MKGGEGMGALGRSVGRISAKMEVKITIQKLSASGCEEKR